MPVGCSAALAAAFNTPIAAVLFSLEEIMGDLHASVLGSVVFSSATSWMVLHLVLGDDPLFHVAAYQLVHPVEFAVYAVLGVVGGLGSVASSSSCWDFARGSCACRSRTVWFQPVAGGLAVGLMGYFVPGSSGRGLRRRGASALNGDMVLRLLVLLAVLKIVATALCYGSGNAGGIFGPALFIGAMMGGAVGSVAHALLPALHGLARRLRAGGHGNGLRGNRADAHDFGDHDFRNHAGLHHHRAAHDLEPDRLLHLS